MKQYLVIIRGGDDLSTIYPTPEDMANHMQEWQKWMGGLAEKEQLIGGEPLQFEGKTILDGGATILDRPFAEGKELVGGYILMKANSLDEATELSKACPGLQHNCSLEIREIAPM